LQGRIFSSYDDFPLVEHRFGHKTHLWRNYWNAWSTF